MLRIIRAVLAVMVSVNFLASAIKADAIELSEVSFTYRQFFPNSQDYPVNFLPNHSLSSELGFIINTTAYKYLQSTNWVHAQTSTLGGSSQGQFRTIGWEYTLGTSLTKSLDLSLYHHSIHTIDTTFPGPSYLQRTGLQLKIYLFTNKNTQSIF